MSQAAIAGSADADRFDAAQPYRLDPQVALRPEPFGALAYHYGNRRLTFIRSAELVDLLRQLEHYDSVDAALTSSPISSGRWPAFRRTLSTLVESEVIRAR